MRIEVNKLEDVRVGRQRMQDGGLIDECLPCTHRFMLQIAYFDRHVLTGLPVLGQAHLRIQSLAEDLPDEVVVLQRSLPVDEVFFELLQGRRGDHQFLIRGR